MDSRDVKVKVSNPENCSGWAHKERWTKREWAKEAESAEQKPNLSSRKDGKGPGSVKVTEVDKIVEFTADEYLLLVHSQLRSATNAPWKT